MALVLGRALLSVHGQAEDGDSSLNNDFVVIEAMLLRESLLNCFSVGCQGVMFPVWGNPGIWVGMQHSIPFQRGR